MGDDSVGLLLLRNMAGQLYLLQARIWYRCFQPLTYQQRYDAIVLAPQYQGWN